MTRYSPILAAAALLAVACGESTPTTPSPATIPEIAPATSSFDDITSDVAVVVDTKLMSLNVGGANGTTNLSVVEQNGDGKNGCNLTGSTTLVVAVSSDNLAVATVSPSSITFTSCGATPMLTVTPHSAGSATISLSQTSNTTSGTFNLAPATFTVTVNPPPGPAAQTITFGALGNKTFGDAPFTVSATANSGLTVDFTATGNCTAGNTNGATITITGAGSCTVTAHQAGNASYSAAPDVPQTFSIAKAATTTTVTCPASVTYNGAAQTPCSATVTGAGSLSQSLTVSYSNNTNAGTATASANYAETANYLGSSDSKNFTIDKASSTTTVACPASVTYNGAAQEPCTAAATGAGGLNQSLAVSYTNNTNAGTATASASYAGDANHDGSNDSKNFTIAKALLTITAAASPNTKYYDATGFNPATFSVTYSGFVNSETSAVLGGTLAFNVTVASGGPYPGVGTYNLVPSGLTSGNYAITFVNGTLTISAWTLNGFYQPVDMSGATIVYNTVKGGSTVPFKFEVFAGPTELTTTSVVKTFTAALVACASGAPIDDIELTTTGGTSLRYDAGGGQFIQNWQTPATPTKCYQVTLTTQDGSTLTAFFKLK
jgi:hypothetical protein